jgi:hypothetical protein
MEAAVFQMLLLLLLLLLQRLVRATLLKTFWFGRRLQTPAIDAIFPLIETNGCVSQRLALEFAMAFEACLWKTSTAFGGKLLLAGLHWHERSEMWILMFLMREICRIRLL